MKLSIILFIYLCLFSIASNLFGQTTEPDELFPILQNGKWGYINRKGVIIIEPQFLGVASKDYHFNIGWSEEGLEPVRFNGGWGYIDKAGNTIIKPRFSDAGRFSNGLARVRDYNENGKVRFGFINKRGEFVVRPHYCIAREFSEGLVFVANYEHDGCYTFSHSTFGTLAEFGYIDKTGQLVLPKLSGSEFSEGLAPVSIGGKMGYVDKQGKVVIQPQFDMAYSFFEGLAYVMVDKIGSMYIDADGKTVISPPPGYSLAGINFSEGYTFVGKDNMWGYIDKTGVIMIKPRFKSAKRFSEGLAPVGTKIGGGKWGYIDKMGKVVIDFKFDKAEPFRGGLALVGDPYGGEVGYIDKTGKYIWKSAK